MMFLTVTFTPILPRLWLLRQACSRSARRGIVRGGEWRVFWGEEVQREREQMAVEREVQEGAGAL
jgi:hypothetical protein